MKDNGVWSSVRGSGDTVIDTVRSHPMQGLQQVILWCCFVYKISTDTTSHKVFFCIFCT